MSEPFSCFSFCCRSVETGKKSNVITLKSNRQPWVNDPSTSVGYENYSKEEIKAEILEDSEVISGSQHDRSVENDSPSNYSENADNNSLELSMDTEISEQQNSQLLLRDPTETSIKSRNTETGSGFISVRSYSSNSNDTISMLSVRSATSQYSYLSVRSSSSTTSDSKTANAKADLPAIAEE